FKTNRRRTLLPCSSERSGPPVQNTVRSIVSPKTGGQSAREYPGMALPSASCISTWIPPAAELEKLRFNEVPLKVIGLVISSPPDAGAFTDTKPSRRRV